MQLSQRRFELVRVVDDRITIAGHLPTGADGAVAGPLGKVGAEVDADDAYRSARRIALGMLASLEAAGIDLDRIGWRKAFGMVNAAPGFNALPGVVNGFSDLILDVFGERGRHSRSAVGVAELPFGAPVEVEAEAVLLPADGVSGTDTDEPAAALVPVPGVVAEPQRTDPGLRGRDYAGISPLSIPAEALVRSIDALSSLFWISIGGTVVTIFLAALAKLGGVASASVPFGEYSIPLSVLPIAGLSFAMFVLWLTASRLKMLDDALGDDDLTMGMARDIFRLDPPVLNVFDAGNLRRFAPLSGVSVLLWNWSLFFGASVGLMFSATIVYGAADSVDNLPTFTGYAVCTLAIMAYGVRKLVPALRRILLRLHGEPLRIGAVRSAAAALVVCAGVLAANPEMPGAMLRDDWLPLGPAAANAIDGETLLVQGTDVVVLVGIKALRPRQTCLDAAGVPYPCGQRATAHLQSLVQDKDVFCFVSYPNLGLCYLVDEQNPPPAYVETGAEHRSLSGLMVEAGYAFVTGDAKDFYGPQQADVQARRSGAWQGAFEPPDRWRGP